MDNNATEVFTLLGDKAKITSNDLVNPQCDYEINSNELSL